MEFKTQRHLEIEVRILEEILREVLAADKSILCRRDELIATLENKVPANLRRDFASIKKALALNVGEKFFVGNSDKEAAQADVAKILKEGGLQEARINFVIETFTNALDWYKPLIPVIADKVETKKKDVQAPKINIVKTVQSKPEEVSEPSEIAPQKPIRQIPEVEKIKREPQRVEKTPQQNNFGQTQSQKIYTTMPKNHKSKIFTTEGRLNRWEYFLQNLKVIGLSVIGGLMSEVHIAFFTILLVAIVGGFMIDIRRLHDLNKSGWWTLILFIPYINVIFGLYILFAPGTQGYNKYGADPLTE